MKHNETLDKEARDFYWKSNPDIKIAPYTRSDLVVSFVAGATSEWVADAAVAFADWLGQFQDMSCAIRQLELESGRDVYQYFIENVYDKKEPS